MEESKTKSLFQENHDFFEESDAPLYLQIMNLIKQHINSGALKPGDLIPSESQLCKIYGISRTTVRQALDLLAEDHLIIRRRGKGSFVAKPKMPRTLNHLYSFTEDIKALNMEPGSRILECKEEAASEGVAEILKIPAGSALFRLTRIRYANNDPLLLEDTRIPLSLCPGISREDFKSESLYKILQEKYGFHMFKAVESLESVKLTKEIADLLDCKVSAPAFKINRVAYLENGTPFELTYSYARGDRFLFKVELFSQRREAHFSREINLD